MESLLVTGTKRLVIAGDTEAAWAADRLGFGDGKKWPADTSALAIYDGENLSATILFNCFFDGATCSAHIVTDGRRNWATRQMLYGIFAFPFLHCGLRRLTAPIASKNTDAVVNAIKLGFKFEGLLRHARADDDEVVLGMLRDECIWIKTGNVNG